MKSNKEGKGIRPWEDAAKSKDEVYLSDMHGDGVHFNREILAKAKRDKQLTKEKTEKNLKKKNYKKNA